MLRETGFYSLREASCQSILYLSRDTAQVPLHAYIRHLFVKPLVIYTHPLSYFLLLQHHTPKLCSLQWQPPDCVAKSQIIYYTPLTLFFSPCFLTLLYFFFSFITSYHETLGLWSICQLMYPGHQLYSKARKLHWQSCLASGRWGGGNIHNLQIPVLKPTSIQDIPAERQSKCWV